MAPCSAFAALRRRKLTHVGCVGIAMAIAIAGIALPLIARTPHFADVLDTAPLRYAAVAKATVTGIAVSGRNVVAVGPRGLVVRSADGGNTWQQVMVPVSADLTSVRFSAPQTVWTVGHDAVILKSTDAGATWSRVLDGRVLLTTLQQAAGTHPSLAKDVARTMAQSASPDVWPTALFDLMFTDADHGFAVGAFGLLLGTTDGGKTWQSWMDRVDNERQFHLYAIRGTGRRPYIAGEQGLLLRLDDAGQRFVRVETPYNGSYFGVEALGTRVLAHGLRGNAYISEDQGKTWQRLNTGTDANIVGAGLEADGLWIATQAGQVLVGDPAGAALTTAASAPGADLYGAVALGGGRFAVARLDGVSTITVRPARAKTP